MNVSGIKNLIIKLDCNKNIKVTPEMFENLYISNINELGDEIAFSKKNKKDINLICNFFMIKLKEKTIEYNLVETNLKENAFNLFKNQFKIKEVIINFKNGYTQPFLLQNNNISFSNKNNNDLCILTSEYDIKYQDFLFI